MARDSLPIHDRRTSLIMMALVVAMGVLMMFLVLSLVHTMRAY